jgi:GH24 family phage-related lysozyme (muramidase)
MLYSTLVSLLLASASLAAPVEEVEVDERALKTYPIKANGVRCRSGPGTSYSVVKTYSAGTKVSISCQATGTNINGDSLWDKTGGNCYVSDYYVRTGTSGYVAPKCGGTKPPGTGGGFCKKLNAGGVALIKEFEGFVRSPAPDPIGLPTVGYGHLCQTKGCGEVKYKFPLTEATATALLNDDLPTYINCLGGKLTSKAKLNDNQWAAVVSLVFNVGCGGISGIIKRLNNGENAGTVIAQEFPKYVNAGGRPLPGLVRRRKAEVALSQRASSKQAFPKCT